MAASRTKPPTHVRLLLGAVLVAALGVGAWAAWPAVGRWHAALLADDLADKALQSTSGATLAVESIESLGLAGIPQLVRLAASQRVDISQAAQDAVANEMARWEFQFATQGDHAAFFDQLSTLSAALEGRAGEFGPDAQRWAHQLARRIVIHCDQLAADQAWTVLACCEAVLTQHRQAIVGRSAIVAESPISSNLSQPGTLPATALPAPSVAVNAPLTAWTPTPSPAGRSRPAADLDLIEQPDAGEFREGTSALDAIPLANAYNSLRSSPLPVTKPQPEAGPVAPPIDIPSPQERRRAMQAYRDLTDADLLAAWQTAPRFAALAMRDVLRQRGYTDALLESISKLRQQPPVERRQSLKHLDALPAADARRVLRMLVVDADADVRLEALTKLATTGDPQLSAIVRQRAVEDDDQRVADLASEIMKQK